MATTGYQAVPLTTIKVQTTTRDRLADVGKKRESYDALINRLIDCYLASQEKD